MQSTDDINLNDIADELLIVDKRTIEHLFELENCADCVALYMFFYKTAKWQGTRSIKANDTYIRKCLGWGARKVTATKKILESAKYIESGYTFEVLQDVIDEHREGLVQLAELLLEREVVFTEDD